MKTIREQTEEYEKLTLSPYAQLVTETKGRRARRRSVPCAPSTSATATAFCTRSRFGV